MVNYENEICAFLRLPSIPKKEWDGKSPFRGCVAIIDTKTGGEAYAVASFNPDNETEPRVTKVFSQEPFTRIKKVFIVPEYMNVDNIKTADLDEESKKRAEELAKEAEEVEMSGVEEEPNVPENEYFFDHIHNDEEARAYIASYNKTNKIKGRVPKTHDGLVMRLSVIYAESNK